MSEYSEWIEKVLRSEGNESPRWKIFDNKEEKSANYKEKSANYEERFAKKESLSWHLINLMRRRLLPEIWRQRASVLMKTRFLPEIFGTNNSAEWPSYQDKQYATENQNASLRKLSASLDQS